MSAHFSNQLTLIVTGMRSLKISQSRERKKENVNNVMLKILNVININCLEY